MGFETEVHGLWEKDKGQLRREERGSEDVNCTPWFEML